MTDESNKADVSHAGDVRQEKEQGLGPAQAATEARLREVVELAARIRHEINNPLTGLIGQAQLLLRGEGLSEPARRRVETIEQLAKRIRDTVAELRVVQHAGPARAGDVAAENESSEGERGPPRH